MSRFAFLVFAFLVFASGSLAAPPSVERGRYLVEQVGMCADCHSPRGPNGAPVPGLGLTGAPIGFAPMHQMPAWGDYAPSLVGTPAGYEAALLSRFLQTGARPDGTLARPPMPPYRLDQDDADAVVAYLGTLAR